MMCVVQVGYGWQRMIMMGRPGACFEEEDG